MKSRAEQLDETSKVILIATDRIRYYKQQDKILQSEIKRLTRNERTHRLCTRGGMVEAFTQEPEKLTDDQVMELLTVAFRQSEVSALLQKNAESNESKTLARRVRAHFYTGQRELTRMCVLRSRDACPNSHPLRRVAPYKGLHPLRCFASILAHL